MLLKMRHIIFVGVIVLLVVQNLSVHLSGYFRIFTQVLIDATDNHQERMTTRVHRR